MALVGEHKNQLRKNPPKDISGEIVVCISPTSTLTKDKEYYTRGCFNYINRYGSGNDHWFDWDTFITIKNDEGYTVKVGIWRFNLKSEVVKRRTEKEVYENNPLNILSEAHELVEQKYI